MHIKLATWNINSVRAHMEIVQKFLKTHDPDILCLQEIKVANGSFPTEPFSQHGYVHQLIHGQKAYHGVAIFAKEHVPFKKPERRYWCALEDARHAYCTIGKNVELHNFYVPAGGDVPDVKKNDKFAHKLKFMTEVADWFAERQAKKNRFILVGDLNVAPLETDVWSHKQLLKVVSHTPIEVDHMQRWYDSHDWVDVVRHFIAPEEKLYSWWSYRSPNWEASDRGRRLDHIWVTPALKSKLKGAEVAKAVRGWPSPSDHAPVIAELEI